MDDPIQQLKAIIIETKSLINAIFNKDVSTIEHSLDVYSLVKDFYWELPERLKAALNKENLLKAALLHDVGKLLIPDTILKKPCALNLFEREIIKNHAANGKIILEKAKIKSISDLVCYHNKLSPLSRHEFQNRSDSHA